MAKHRPNGSLLSAALNYANDGFAVLPLCRRGKTPLTKHGVHDASTDPAVIQRWWGRTPDANIGVAVPAGILVLDLDRAEARTLLEVVGGPLPHTAAVETGRGHHLWFRAEADVPVQNRVRVVDGVDVRAQGGYCVAPPSVHPTGATYRWLVPLGDMVEAPEWLVTLVTQRTRHEGQAHNEKNMARDDWAKVFEDGASEGCRNNTLARVAGYLYRKLPPRIAYSLGTCWAREKLRQPLSEAEVRRVLDSIAKAELSKREAPQ